MATESPTMPQKAREVWRKGIAPNLTLAGLLALKLALETDDPRLIQRLTCDSSIMSNVPMAACAIGFACWQGEDIDTDIRVLERFEDVCSKSDAAFNEPAYIRYFLNWVDDTPRETMIAALLPEVILAIEESFSPGIIM